MNLSISLFHSFTTLQGFQNIEANLELQAGDFVSISGISGSGKTTFLKILAGLVHPVQGDIRFGAQIWLDTQRGYVLPPQKRKIGFVFQDYALFPNMTVLENIQFSGGKFLDKNYLNDMIEALGLGSLLTRFMHQLSGGQQQRVAVARALISKPRFLFLDEPYSALDETSRKSVQSFVFESHRKFSFTTLLVNHQLSDVRVNSNKFLKFEAGKIEAFQPPQEFHFMVPGVILSKEMNEGPECRLIVLYRGMHYSVPLPNSEAEKFHVGDPITFGIFNSRETLS